MFLLPYLKIPVRLSYNEFHFSSPPFAPPCSELLMRFELTTSSLPRKCSTPELQQLFRSGLTARPPLTSGRRGSNPRPTAWKAVALPTELLPHVPRCFSMGGHTRLRQGYGGHGCLR